jgi:kynurenine formamidase
MRWTQRPEGSNWGEFGPDDVLGRLNLITPARRLAALREVREGIVFPLSLPLDYPKGEGISKTRTPPRLFSTSGPHNHLLSDRHIDVGCDDGVQMSLQYSTQWDAFSHIGALFDADADGILEMVYYNGYRGSVDILADDSGIPNAGPLGIDRIAQCGVQGRGVLVDLSEEAGHERRVIGYHQLMAAMKSQSVEVDAGDLLCIYTGLDELILAMGEDLTPDIINSSCAVLDGHDERLQNWISGNGIAALISDNVGVEAWGKGMRDCGNVLLPLHHLCLFKLGIPLGELWYLSELAKWLRRHSRSRFLLTAPPLRLPGAVGSPVTPVATV